VPEFSIFGTPLTRKPTSVDDFSFQAPSANRPMPETGTSYGIPIHTHRVGQVNPSPSGFSNWSHITPITHSTVPTQSSYSTAPTVQQRHSTPNTVQSQQPTNQMVGNQNTLLSADNVNAIHVLASVIRSHDYSERDRKFLNYDGTTDPIAFCTKYENLAIERSWTEAQCLSHFGDHFTGAAKTWWEYTKRVQMTTAELRHHFIRRFGKHKDDVAIFSEVCRKRQKQNQLATEYAEISFELLTTMIHQKTDREKIAVVAHGFNSQVKQRFDALCPPPATPPQVVDFCRYYDQYNDPNKGKGPQGQQQQAANKNQKSDDTNQQSGQTNQQGNKQGNRPGYSKNWKGKSQQAANTTQPKAQANQQPQQQSSQQSNTSAQPAQNTQKGNCQGCGVEDVTPPHQYCKGCFQQRTRTRKQTNSSSGVNQVAMAIGNRGLSPQITFVFDRTAYVAMVDTGSTYSIAGKELSEHIAESGTIIKQTAMRFKTANGEVMGVEGTADIPITIGKQTRVCTMYLCPTLADLVLIGMDLIIKFAILTFGSIPIVINDPQALIEHLLRQAAIPQTEYDQVVGTVQQESFDEATNSRATSPTSHLYCQEQLDNTLSFQNGEE